MLQRYPKKPCRYCNQNSHFSYQCYKNPKRKPISPKGKHTVQWFKTRDTWIRKNPPNHQGYWYCYLNISKNCPIILDSSTLTLDHVKSRSRHPELRLRQDNLRPCCIYCNRLKGSRDIEDIF